MQNETSVCSWTAFLGQLRVLLILCLGKVSQWKMHAQEAPGLRSMGGMLVTAAAAAAAAGCVFVKTASCQAACSMAGPESHGLGRTTFLEQESSKAALTLDSPV